MAGRWERVRERPATAGLIAVCTIVFVAGWVAAGLRAEEPGRVLLRSLWSLDDVELLDQIGALTAVRVWLDSQWWRLLTAGFLHGSWLHLGLNMLGLWTVGQWTERAWGWWRQLVVFMIASVGGCAASLAWAEAPVVVGASAGIFGIAGALVGMRAWGRADLQQAVEPVSARTLGSWLVFWLVLGAVLPAVFGVSVLAQAGHLGGLVFGVLAGMAFSWPTERRVARIGAWLTATIGLLGTLAWGAAPKGRPNYDLFMGSELLGRGEFAAAAGHFDRALEGSGGAVEDPELANAVAYALAEAESDLDRAEQLVRAALEQQPDSADFLDTLGWVLCRQGRVEEGSTALKAAEAAASREIPEIAEHLSRCGE